MTMNEYPTFSSTDKKKAVREQLKRDMAAFLSEGGKIKKCDQRNISFDYAPKFNQPLRNA